MSVFIQKNKPFEGSDDDDDDDGEMGDMKGALDYLPSKKKGTKKRKGIHQHKHGAKRPVVVKKVDADAKIINLLESDEEDDTAPAIVGPNAHVQEELQKIYSSTLLPDEDDTEITPPPVAGVKKIDSVTQRAHELLNRAKKAVATLNSQVQSSSSSSPTNHTADIDLTADYYGDSSGVGSSSIGHSQTVYRTRNVPTALDRMKATNRNNGDFSLQNLQKLVPGLIDPTMIPLHRSSSNDVVDLTDSVERVKLQTRLLGSQKAHQEHIKRWKVPKNEQLGKLRAKFGEVYDLPPASFQLTFDGDPIADDETPESLDMEDDNIIDVKIDHSLFAGALLAVKSFEEQHSGKRDPLSVPLASGNTGIGGGNGSSSGAGAGVHLIKPKTRLIGSSKQHHEWKWSLPPTETFREFRAKFATLYKLEPMRFKFSFDGDTIEDSQSMQSLDIENDDIIDVKIDSSLFPDAVAAAANAT